MSNFRQQKNKIDNEIKKWQKEKQIILAKQKLKEEKKEIKNLNKKSKLSTSKFLMLFLFISCSIIEIFTMYVTIKGMNMGLGADFGPLQMLIAAIVGEVIGYAVYSLKALKENTAGGIVYESNLLNTYTELIGNTNKQEINNTQEAKG